MNDRFEVGKSYRWADPGPDPFTVLARTEKTIVVTNRVNTWRMRLRYDDRGEYVKDSSMDRSSDPYSMFISRPQWVDESWTAYWANR